MRIKHAVCRTIVYGWVERVLRTFGINLKFEMKRTREKSRKSPTKVDGSFGFLRVVIIRTSRPRRFSLTRNLFRLTVTSDAIHFDSNVFTFIPLGHARVRHLTTLCDLCSPYQTFIFKTMHCELANFSLRRNFLTNILLPYDSGYRLVSIFSPYTGRVRIAERLSYVVLLVTTPNRGSIVSTGT